MQGGKSDEKAKQHISSNKEYNIFGIRLCISQCLHRG